MSSSLVRELQAVLRRHAGGGSRVGRVGGRSLAVRDMDRELGFGEDFEDADYRNPPRVGHRM